jgi:hypothetical protein
MLITAILAPVPCVHISTGLDTCQRYGRVAFGSDAERVFVGAGGKSKISQGTKFFIIATRPQYGCAHLHSPGNATFEAEFVQWVAGIQGKHPNENLRPVSTGDDCPLKALAKHIPFSSFSIPHGRNKKKFASVMGPVKVVLDNE